LGKELDKIEGKKKIQGKPSVQKKIDAAFLRKGLLMEYNRRREGDEADNESGKPTSPPSYPQ